MKNYIIKKQIGIFILLFSFIARAWGATGFTVKKIDVEGLNRVNLGTFLSYMPIKKGDWFDYSASGKIIDTLYKTGFFNKVNLYRRDNTLVVIVSERPTIGAIHISGNKKIKTKQLLDALKQQGFSEGEVFNRAILVGARQALLEQYYNLGRYNARVDTKVTAASRNRVIVDINISEGPVAKIKEIKIIGNHKFTDKQLLKDFSLTTSGFFTIFTSADQYSKEKLDADLEKLRSYYLDRGYLEFKIDSTQVSITPDKQHVYIIIHVTEGPVYTVSGVGLAGNLLGKGPQIEKLILIHQGDIFSRQKVIDTNTAITKFLGDFGYAFVEINPEPKLNRANHTVFVNFVVQPGKRVYVNRVTFSGNTKTADTVLRREMRQPESGLFSLSGIEESKRRLNNLGYLKDVHSELNPVSGQPDKVDLQYDVTEQSAAAASLNFGYSDLDKFIYGASVNNRNFLGSGKTVGVQFNRSHYTEAYSVNYFNPYFTKSGISLDTNIYYQKTKLYNLSSVSDYATDNAGVNFTYGIPVSEHSRINLGYGYEHDRIKTDSSAPTEIKNFIAKHGNIFDNVTVNTGWQYSNLDRAIFPTKGFVQEIGGEAGVPVLQRNLEYYKVSYTATGYQPLTKYFVLNAHGFLGYGNGYGKMSDLPFFENYFAGGIGSVRGYSAQSLGPLDSNGNAIGGNVSIYGSLGLIIPSPVDSVRPTLFVDAGNVYNKQLNFGQLRYSAGIQVEWYTPLAPLVFSLAAPLHKQSGDDTEPFQFQIGLSF